MNRNSLTMVALLASLAVNLMIVGFIVGKHRAGAGERPPMAWAAEHLSSDTKQRLRSQMRAQLPKVRPLREEMRRAQMAVREAAAAEAYDPEVLATSLERSRKVGERYQALIHRSLVEVSAELPKDQRIALANATLHRGHNTKMPPRPPQDNR